jgi:hypothetical protein
MHEIDNVSSNTSPFIVIGYSIIMLCYVDCGIIEDYNTRSFNTSCMTEINDLFGGLMGNHDVRAIGSSFNSI